MAVGSADIQDSFAADINVTLHLRSLETEIFPGSPRSPLNHSD